MLEGSKAGRAKISPSASVYVLHREMRSYGFQEGWYEQARREGVVFLRYDVGREPQLEPMGDALEITVVESDLGLPVVLEVDAVALAVEFGRETSWAFPVLSAWLGTITVSSSKPT